MSETFFFFKTPNSNPWKHLKKEFHFQMKKVRKYYITLDRLTDSSDAPHFVNFFSKHNQSAVYIYLCQTRDQSLFVNLTFWQKHVKRQKRTLSHACASVFYPTMTAQSDSCYGYRENNRSGLVSTVSTKMKKNIYLFLPGNNRICLKLSQTLNITKYAISN